MPVTGSHERHGAVLPLRVRPPACPLRPPCRLSPSVPRAPCGLGFSPDPAGPFRELARWGAALSAAGGSSPAQRSPPGLALACPPEPAGSSSLDIGRGSSALRSGPLGSPPTSDTL